MEEWKEKAIERIKKLFHNKCTECKHFYIGLVADLEDMCMFMKDNQIDWQAGVKKDLVWLEGGCNMVDFGEDFIRSDCEPDDCWGEFEEGDIQLFMPEWYEK